MLRGAKIPAVFAVLTLAACAGGCGGSGADTAPTITKTQFVRRADAICEAQDQSMIAASDVYTRHHRNSNLSTSELHLASIGASLPASLRGQVRQLRALGSPPGDARQLRQFYAAEEQAIASSSGKRPTTIEQLFAWYERPDRLANAYGIRTCSIL